MNLRLLDVLSNIADSLVTELEADACAISRVIGDALILVAERVHDGGTLQMGQGYLVPDFPETADLLANGGTRALTLDDPDVDEAEARVLRQHGFGSLLMLPLHMNDTVWGLVEVYRIERRSFTDADARRARELTRVG
jgi:GAF domain-containing protein